jgi:hypothetical protein
VRYGVRCSRRGVGQHRSLWTWRPLGTDLAPAPAAEPRSKSGARFVWRAIFVANCPRGAVVGTPRVAAGVPASAVLARAFATKRIFLGPEARGYIRVSG